MWLFSKSVFFSQNKQQNELMNEEGAKGANYLFELRGKLTQNQETKDCSLVMDSGETLDVHLALLCQVWPSLIDLLNTQSLSCSCEKRVILLPSTKDSTMRKVLELIYTGKCRVKKMQEIKEVKDLSSRLGLSWVGSLSSSLTIVEDSDYSRVEVLLGDEGEESVVGKDIVSSDCSSNSDSVDEEINKSVESIDTSSSQYFLPPVRYTNTSQQSNLAHLVKKKETVCSLNCQFHCKQSITVWSHSERESLKTTFSGLSLADVQRKLLRQLEFQERAGISTGGFFSNKQLLCVKQFSELSTISTYILKKVLTRFGSGHRRYFHGNTLRVKKRSAGVQFCGWMKVFSQKYGQDGPDDIVTVLPSYLNKSELFKLYLEESPAPHLKRSAFYKAFKDNFGPRRKDKSLPWVRISKESSHSKCDVCLGLDHFLRTTQSDAEVEFARGLKQKHSEIYSGARVAVTEFIQKSRTSPDEVVSFQIDSMDNSKSQLPRVLERSKQLSGMFRLPAKITGCITTSSKYADQAKCKFYINHGRKYNWSEFPKNSHTGLNPRIYHYYQSSQTPLIITV